MAAPTVRRCWVLKERPTQEAQLSHFEFQEQAFNADLAKGQLLLKTLYLEPHPAMFGRIRSEANYTAGVQLGEVMHCGGIAQVVASKSSAFQPGDLVQGMVKMQDWQVADGKGWNKLNPICTDPVEAMTLLGLNMVTAYFLLRDLGQPKPGQTLVVSAGAGHVGSLVGQMGRIAGCRTVALCGSEEKVQMCLTEFGYDAAINYKTYGNDREALTKAVESACPKGVDIFFDNVSGDQPVALFPLFNLRARWIVCGRIALANLANTMTGDIGPRDASLLIVKQVVKLGGHVMPFLPRTMESVIHAAKWNKAGKLKAPADIRRGIEEAVPAQLSLLTGSHLGKVMVQVLEPEPLPKPASSMARMFRNLVESAWFPTDWYVFFLKCRAGHKGLYLGDAPANDTAIGSTAVVGAFTCILAGGIVGAFLSKRM
mmetsp:Transcript_8076/g.15135  ORF Transcript_8076/g.15135 Transcript_8076/m.15135 type:complete len:427 (+) Transcript_8076:80-1360(+)